MGMRGAAQIWVAPPNLDGKTPSKVCLRHDKCTTHFSLLGAMGYIVRYGARLT